VTERFNYTLHQVMRAFAQDNPSDWPEWLNQFLFAYPEVPQSTRGLAPAEIVYNRSNFRGPLAVLRDTWNSHLNHINDVLRRIYAVGLTIKASKCQWALERLICLGYIIEDGKIKPDDAKIEAIKNAPTPTTKKQLRSWLGLIGYYRSLIRGHSSHTFSITEMLKKSAPDKLQWTLAHQQSFEHCSMSNCKPH
jgi:hypothetical protein